MYKSKVISGYRGRMTESLGHCGYPGWGTWNGLEHHWQPLFARKIHGTAWEVGARGKIALSAGGVGEREQNAHGRDCATKCGANFVRGRKRRGKQMEREKRRRKRERERK